MVFVAITDRSSRSTRMLPIHITNRRPTIPPTSNLATCYSSTSGPKLTQSRAVYYDITWTGFCGEVIPDAVRKVFEVVRDARKRGSQFVIDRVSQKKPIAGFEVDDAVRGFINQADYGQYFFHRTGHSIGTEVHGTGANMDNLESHDERRITPGSCFSIEPGIYLPEFGIRSEVNVYVGEGFARVTGEQQEQMVHLL